MRLGEIITTALMCLPVIYATIKVVLSFEIINPFLAIGFIMILLLLLDPLAEVIVPVLCALAFTSLILAYFGQPIPILSLASAFIISSSLIGMLVMCQETKPHTRLSIYILSIFVAMVLLRTLQGALSPQTFFTRFLNAWIACPHYSEELYDPTFLILMAPSVIGFLGSTLSSNRSITSLALSCEVSIALISAAILVLIISLLPDGAAWMASVISALSASIFLMFYLRLIR
ncbi:MAG: hypothetical protein QW692_03500 [Nitrososphaerota archaeon]